MKKVIGLFLLMYLCVMLYLAKDDGVEVTRENQMRYVWGYNALPNEIGSLHNFVFAGEAKPRQPFIYEMVLKDWDVRNSDDFIKLLTKLETGQIYNEKFKRQFAHLFAMSEREFFDYLTELKNENDPALTLVEKIRDEGLNLKKHGIIAWDLAIASYLLGVGYKAEYISKKEAYEHTLIIGRTMQKHFTSYAEMTDNYLIGYWYEAQSDEQHNEHNEPSLIIGGILRKYFTFYEEMALMNTFYYESEPLTDEKYKAIAYSLLNRPDTIWEVFPFNFDMTRLE